MKNLTLEQFDVKTAFLNGKLEETIYMEQSEGYKAETQRVCKLKKSLYGLKQASRCWNRRLTKFLAQHNLKQSQADPSVFTRGGDAVIILAIYVDDGLIAAKNNNTADILLGELGKEFKIIIEELKVFLSLQIKIQSDGSITINQMAYTKKLLETFKMEDANPVTIPMDKGYGMSAESHSQEQILTSNTPYREAVGSLMHLAVGTRPDIMYALGVVSRHLDKPTKTNWNAVKRIFKYLRRTVNYGLKFTKSMNLELTCYCDAGFAGDVETRKSTSGYLLKIGDNTIAWGSQKQRVVTLSTAEAEYVAATQGLKELI